MMPIILALNQARHYEDRPSSSLFILGLLLLLAQSIRAASTTAAGSEDNLNNLNNLDNLEDVPLFEQTASNVSGFEGQTVYLPCRVHNLGDKVVSWMRRRDLHILTSGDFSYSSDPRFKPQHLSGSDAWTLRLDHLRKSDAGGYECQVNTEPKIMYAVHLTVRDLNKPDGHDEPHSQQTRISYESTAPVAAIMGPRELRVQQGSTITIKCLITSPYQTRPIKAVQWFRDNKLLTFQAARGGINVETVTGMAQTLTEATLSNLTIQDTGKYSCRPTEGKLDTIIIHVQDGERSEAMQRDSAYTTSGVYAHCINWPIWLVQLLLAVLLYPNIRPLATLFYCNI